MKLSQDNELIALYALGLQSKKILKSILLLGLLFSILLSAGLLFSILLSALSFLGIPMSKQLYNAFKEKKKSEATLNIIPGKLGQKFGEYYIYVKEILFPKRPVESQRSGRITSSAGRVWIYLY